MKQAGIDLLEHIPDYTYFYTLEEFDRSSRALARRFPETVELREIGKTREGRPLLCLKIGRGHDNVLMMGCPHPNEPIGSMLLEYFSQQLASSDALRAAYPYTFYIVKVWDADAYKKNEGWLKGPYTVTNYARNIFRPAGYEQVDWTFPVDYKKLHFHDSIPETLAMKALIDEIRPKFIYSLHNSGFGGVYWYMTKPLERIFPQLWEIPRKNGLPLSLGEAESPSAEVFGDAIFSGSGGVIAQYDYLEKYNGEEAAAKLRCGNNAASYSFRNYGSFTLLTELPYFYDPRIEDQTPSPTERRAGILRKSEENGKMSRELREILAVSRDYMGEDNPFRKAVEAFSAERGSSAALKNMVDADESYHRQATVAEELDMRYVSKFYKLISYGMLVRANKLALERLEPGSNSEAETALKKGQALAEAAFDRVAAMLEEALHYSVVPIRNLIAVQLESGLLTMEELEHGTLTCGEG